MANTFTSVVKQHWEKGLQMNLERTLVAMDLGTTKIIPDGTTLNLPRLAFQSTQTYTKYTNLTFSDLTTASDTLTLNSAYAVTFSMDVIDEGDNYINISPQAIRNGGVKLKERLDGDFLAEILNASFVYDNAGLRANSGTITPITLATGASQNVSAVFGDSNAYLVNAGADVNNIALVVDAFTLNTINTIGLETGFDVADEAYTNKVARGYRGRFLGMDVYTAACLTTTRVLDLATLPTAGDTVTINGQVFTFVSSIGTTAGNVLIGADVDTTRGSLATLLNAPGTTTSTGVAVTDPSRFDGLTAANDNTANTLTITSKRGRTLASSSMTNASNDWAAETINCAVMEKGSIYMAIRDSVKVSAREEPQKLVTNFIIYSRYGLVTPQSGKERMVRVAVTGSAAEA